MINFYFANLVNLILPLISSAFTALAQVSLPNITLLHIANAINHMILTRGALGIL